MADKSFSKLSSDTISALRFPLMVGIVFIHFDLSEGLTMQGVKYGADMPLWYVCMTTFLSNVLPRIGVPLFFLISGYLFFLSGLNKDSYKGKLQKRARTLLVPFIMWNLIALLYASIKMLPKLKPMFPGYGDWNLSLSGFLNTFWDNKNGLINFVSNDPVESYAIYPQDIPMWYVRDLMIMMVFAPLFYWVIKKIGWYAVAMLGLAWYIIVPLFIPEEYGHLRQLTTAAFFFSWGACLAIKGVDFAPFMRRFSLVPWLYIVVAIADVLTKEWEYGAYVHKAQIVFGIVTAVSLTASLLEKDKLRVNKFLANSSFFLFALHTLFMGDLSKVIVKLFFIDSPAYMVVLYFLVPCVTIAVCLALYWLLRSYAPRVAAVLTGGR